MRKSLFSKNEKEENHVPLSFYMQKQNYEKSLFFIKHNMQINYTFRFVTIDKFYISVLAIIPALFPTIN